MLNSNALRKLDMQDLMVFVSVYEQRNLTLVAEALQVSQSTVSYCLKKLRANFEDDLFISTRKRHAARHWPCSITCSRSCAPSICVMTA